MNNNTVAYNWVGSERNFVDEPNVIELNNVFLGRHGGNSSAGQYKNEDGCLIWTSDNCEWEFAVLFDAHKSAESAELVIQTINVNKVKIEQVLDLPVNESMKKIEEVIVTVFQSSDFRAACKKVNGETACLIVFRKDKYIWWLSIGDCVLYLFHSELNTLGQYQINQRHFYEWIGQVNTFDLIVPCYSSGVRELRNGENQLFMATDGLIECPNTRFANPREIVETMKISSHESALQYLLDENIKNNVRDSTTIISWVVDIDDNVSYPSDQKQTNG